MPPRVPRVQYLQPTRSFERSGGQATFLHPLAGTRSLGDGVYAINPHEASYGANNPLAILRQQAMNTGDMARVAEKLRLEDPRRKYGMVESALEDAVMAGNKLSPNEEMRLLMQVDSSGRPVGAATYQKGDVYGLGSKDSLDFTQPEPGTLHSLGVLGAQEDGKRFMRGQDYIQRVQDELGNPNLCFETINKPEFSNLEYYYNLGARPTGKVRTGGNPFYEFRERAAREAEEPNADQLRLPGFAGGGLIKYLSSLHGIPPVRPAQLYDSAVRAEMEVAPALRAKLLSERPLTEAELERVNGFATYPVKVRPGQGRTYFPGDIQSAITGEGMRRGGLASLKECHCG